MVEWSCSTMSGGRIGDGVEAVIIGLSHHDNALYTDEGQKGEFLCVLRPFIPLPCRIGVAALY
jgi:hypothetical protein